MKRSLSLIVVAVMLLILLSACNGNSDNNESIYSGQSVLSNTTDIFGSETSTSDNTSRKTSVDDKESKSDNNSINTDSLNISFEKFTTPESSAKEGQTNKPSSSGLSNESSKAIIISLKHLRSRLYYKKQLGQLLPMAERAWLEWCPTDCRGQVSWHVGGCV